MFTRPLLENKIRRKQDCICEKMLCHCISITEVDFFFVSLPKCRSVFGNLGIKISACQMKDRSAKTDSKIKKLT
jgi:hypothetical protein